MTASPDARPLLPALSPAEQRHSDALAALIRRRIAAAGGWLSFEDFMELALYAPGLGYYSGGSSKIGRSGDFVTAPEVSDLFSMSVAQQCAQVLRFTGGSILELGAGTGRMAIHILKTLQTLDLLPEQYAILEISADLRERQRRAIEALPAALRDRVAWLDRLPEEPMEGVILANEVLDALPVQRFRVRQAGAEMLGVSLGPQGAFIEAARPAPPELARILDEIMGSLGVPLPEGYQSEVCVRINPWVGGIADCLERGALLLFDYGLPRAHFYHPQRDRGTLRCHFRHRAHDDPFINVGVQDITAWVDFTRVAEAADAAGLTVSGFATQAAFLLGSGIEQLAAAAPDELSRLQRAGELNRLLLPAEMGEAFKVMALTRDCGIPLIGFSVQDLRASL